MNTTGSHDWYTIVLAGAACYGDTVASPPSGPWRGREAASEAIDRWSARVGWEAGNYQNFTNMRVVGPFCTREIARRADMSDYPDDLCRHGRSRA